jgi:hypothetical protein
VQQLFADGLGSLTVIGGIVRVELCTQGRAPSKAQNEGKEAQVALIPALTLNMPIDGFANMVPHFQQLLEKLEKDGILKRQHAASPTSGSPNFN